MKSNERMYICGGTGSGKTHFCKNYLLRNLKANGIKYIVFDLEHEYTGHGRAVYNIPQLKEAVKKTDYILYQPLPNKSARLEHERVCRFILEYVRDIIFITDEVHIVAPNNAIGRNFKSIQTRGRKMGIGAISISQRPQLTDKTILTQAQHILIFKLRNKDIEYMAGYVGDLSQLAAADNYSYAYQYQNKLEFFNPI